MKFFLAGIVILILGLILVHKVTRSDGRIKRGISVLVAMIGCGLVWSSLATTLPVYTRSSLTLVDYGQDWIVLKADYKTLRNCQVERFDARISDGLTTVQIPTTVLAGGINEEGKDFVYILIHKDIYMTPERINISVEHMCPFGLEIHGVLPTLTLYRQPSNSNTSYDNSKL